MLAWVPRNFDGVIFTGGVLYKNSLFSTNISEMIQDSANYGTPITTVCDLSNGDVADNL